MCYLHMKGHLGYITYNLSTHHKCSKLMLENATKPHVLKNLSDLSRAFDRLNEVHGQVAMAIVELQLREVWK